MVLLNNIFRQIFQKKLRAGLFLAFMLEHLRSVVRSTFVVIINKKFNAFTLFCGLLNYWLSEGQWILLFYIPSGPCQAPLGHGIWYRYSTGTAHFKDDPQLLLNATWPSMTEWIAIPIVQFRKKKWYQKKFDVRNQTAIIVPAGNALVKIVQLINWIPSLGHIQI